MDGVRRVSTPAGRPTPSSRSPTSPGLEFDKPDLDRTEAFAHAFGFRHRALRTDTELMRCAAAMPAPRA